MKSGSTPNPGPQLVKLKIKTLLTPKFLNLGTHIQRQFMSDREQSDPSSEPHTVDVKPVEMSDEEWSCEKTTDELQCNLAAVEQKVTNHGGQVITIRKYQSLCRGLGRYIPIAKPTPEFPICLSDLKPEVRKVLEFYHPELTRLLVQQAVLRLFEAVGIEPYISIGRKLVVKLIGDQNV
jgi:hypothetical protein